MGEIKGQLIGMLVVISIGACIGLLLVTAFKTNATNLVNQMNSESNYVPTSIGLLRSFFIK